MCALKFGRTAYTTATIDKSAKKMISYVPLS